MIVASLVLILVAVALLVLGLAGGSSLLLIISIAASLLAAVALVVGARQAAAARATADPARTGQRDPGASRAADPAGQGGAYGPIEPEIPVQHVPPTVGSGGGWRQPPVPQAGDRPPPSTTGQVGAYDDEPGAQPVTPAEVSQMARLSDEVQVVDGRPRYHLADCAHLRGRVCEPLPVAEAVELGFTPCARCEPATALLADVRPS
ncbi:hypothetical protein [Micromonospora avicenniae]|uniref:Clumping factor A n=1 Tax=Micromonospora avicenniae TaxID=1198245 RepID=A0A1N6SHF3_9ACTN|nr:hypothetical protein [Micromonospora avicenniae]SIQ40480.1 hypothetical protein SAMN05444858_102265 [Micromonospora avicenniae]